MKKYLVKVLLSSVIVLFVGINFGSRITSSNLESENEKALIEAIAGSGEGNVCWGVIDECYIFSCYRVTHCGDCSVYKADGWSWKGSC